MSLSLALNNALSGLNVSQRTMAVISNNIANANTEGYSRQIVDLASVTYDGTGQGVRVEDVVRKIDQFLQTAITKQASTVGKSDIINEFMERAQVLLGDPNNQTSIDAHVETFFNQLQSMAETPERTSTRAAVVESATNLSREVSNLAEGFENLRFQADTEISQGVNAVNTSLKKLYTLNEAIARADAFGTSKATLLDQRDTELNKVAEYLDVRSYEQENGTVHLYVGEGVSILDDSLYELSYTKIGSVQTLIDDGEIRALEINQVSPSGSYVGTPFALATGDTSSKIERNFSSGKLAGLMDMRDSVFPDMLAQLDTLASTIRDQFNAIHNQGSGYPPAAELTGTRPVGGGDRNAWTGSVRLAVLDKSGQPAPPAYSNETSGLRPLTLDLENIYNGTGYGEPDVQTIIDEINNHFGIPQNKLTLGNLNQIQLALSSDQVPGPNNALTFDFDIENISGQYGDFWVHNVQVLDDTGTDISVLPGRVTDTLPVVNLSAVNTFTTTAGSNLVEITTSAAHSLKPGDRVKLYDPGVPVNGIPGIEFDDYFEIESITGNSFFVRTPTAATSAGTASVAGQVARPPYATIDAGDKTRLQQSGSITTSLIDNSASTYYDIKVSMAVRDEDGTETSTIVTYRVQNPESNTRNDRISATAVTPGFQGLTLPNTTQGYAYAMLVDKDGNELPKVNGEYGDQEGYLKIVSLNPNYTISLDELNSKELGLPNDVPAQPGSNRGFSHYFELNNFFQSNDPTDTGDTLKNSAYYMGVEDRFRDNPSLISTGNLERSNQPADPAATPLYTYERFSGDHSVAQQLAKLGISSLTFDAAGGLPDTQLTLNGYAGEVLGYFTTLTASASSTLKNDTTINDGFKERASAISGVNLDEELANTVIYQNAYTASARIITVTDELFKTLIDAV